jgi:hypothetical protein
MNIPLTSLSNPYPNWVFLDCWQGLENEISKVESHSPFEYLKH